MEWKQIETAPVKKFDKDSWFMPHSERLLLWNGYCCQIGTYNYTRLGKGKWESGGRVVYPTHWMLLPEEPK